MSTGYEGGGKDEKFVGTQIWKVIERATPGQSFLAVVEVQEGTKRRVLGYLTCRDEAECKWLQKTIEGDRRVE